MLKLLNVIALYEYYVVKVQIAISLKKIFSVWIQQNPHIQPYKTQILHTKLTKLVSRRISAYAFV